MMLSVPICDSYHLKEIQRVEHIMQFYFIFYSTQFKAEY